MTPIEELRARVATACPEGQRATSIPRLGLMRSDAPTVFGPGFYQPVVCFAAQGRKQISVAGRDYAYDSEHYLAVALDLPVMARITEASPEAPYLVIRLSLDPGLLAGLMLDMPGAAGLRSPGLGIGRMEPDLLDAVLRMVRLIDRPEEAAALAPWSSARSSGGCCSARRDRCCARSPSPTAGWRGLGGRSAGSGRISTSRCGLPTWPSARR